MSGRKIIKFSVLTSHFEIMWIIVRWSQCGNFWEVILNNFAELATLPIGMPEKFFHRGDDSKHWLFSHQLQGSTTVTKKFFSFVQWRRLYYNYCTGNVTLSAGFVYNLVTLKYFWWKIGKLLLLISNAVWEFWGMEFFSAKLSALW